MLGGQLGGAERGCPPAGKVIYITDKMRSPCDPATKVVPEVWVSGGIPWRSQRNGPIVFRQRSWTWRPALEGCTDVSPSGWASTHPM